MKVYGYIRVSTREQNLSRQYDSMYAEGLTDEDIFADKQSGKNFSRPAYERLLQTVKEGDVILFHSLDRMGRNYREMGEQWHLITQEMKVNVRVLDMPLLDTTKTRNDITGILISDIVFKLLCYMAQLERDNLLKRQMEGIEAAKARGVTFGHPERPKPEGFEETVLLWQAGEISGREAARRLGCANSTFIKWMKKAGLKQ